jgi:hypothetical protein
MQARAVMQSISHSCHSLGALLERFGYSLVFGFKSCLLLFDHSNQAMSLAHKVTNEKVRQSKRAQLHNGTKNNVFNGRRQPGSTKAHKRIVNDPHWAHLLDCQ